MSHNLDMLKLIYSIIAYSLFYCTVFTLVLVVFVVVSEKLKMQLRFPLIEYDKAICVLARSYVKPSKICG
jgi:hypothetical protein